MRSQWFILAVLFFQIHLLAEERNFLIYDLNSHTWLKKEGPHCDVRISPCSTFKIPLSLIGFDTGILLDETTPTWPFSDDYTGWLPQWRQAHNPRDWMHNSCIWFSQRLTALLGMTRLLYYLDLFEYGNQDLSGDPGEDNGLKKAWLGSSLQISPREQIYFLIKMLRNELPISQRAVNTTKQILLMEHLPNGWTLYGKTGSGFRQNPDGSINRDLQIGWYVGWLEKDHQTLLFAFNLLDDEEVEAVAGRRAKENARGLLLQFIQ